MNPRQVTVLWIIAIALGIILTVVKVRQESVRNNPTERTSGETLFEKFPADDVATITLTDANQTITLKKTGDKWTVADRDGYPARTPNIFSLLRTIEELEIIQAMEAGPELANEFVQHFGMDESGELPKDVSITAAFGNADGGEIARITVGRTGENGGRFIRNHADDSGFYAINDMLMLLDADPIRWLDESFIRVEKISSIHVAEADKPDIKLWHVSRESEDGDFRLADGAPGETLEATAGDTFKRLMGFARFSDVVPAAEVEARTATDAAKPRLATVDTFEGFTYTFTITPAKPQAAADPDLPPPAADDQLLTVSVEATLPAERKKTDDETEESAAELDKAFAERLETLTTRLEKERSFAGRTFVVARSVVEPLLKERDDITAPPPEPTTATEAAPPTPPLEGAAIGNPVGGGGITVTTPPIEIPARPAPEPEEE